MRLLLFCCFSFLTLTVSAQSKYWVYFTDKDQTGTPQVSKYCQQQRSRLGIEPVQATDFPVNTNYLQQLHQLGTEVTYASRWLNAASTTLTPGQAQQLAGQSWVKAVELAGPELTVACTEQEPKLNPALYAKVLRQMNAQDFYRAGLTGKGVKVGVIDAGFLGAPHSPFLRKMFEKNQVTGVRDYVKPANPEPYSLQQTGLDFHGTEVLIKIGGYNPETRQQGGAAPDAHFYLARTDHGKNENRLEEENYVAALEWMDSLGVRLINTSLGYATGFDDPKENYKPSQMDGSSVISRACQIAFEQKGMLIVVAAGNEGADSKWRVISTPADAKDVLSVGATDFESWQRAGYSGIGPEALPYLKPDVASYSPNGTSFSAPAVTGFVACLMQKDSSLTNKELLDLVRTSGHLYPFGNNYVGYGVPKADNALFLMHPDAGLVMPAELKIKGGTWERIVSATEMEPSGIVLFHKKDGRLVMKQEKAEPKKGQLTVKRLPGAARTTVQIGNSVTELIWE
jgi:subtilisin family serine protease